MSIRPADLIVSKQDKDMKKALIQKLTNKVCDRNDEALRRLSKN